MAESEGNYRERQPDGPGYGLLQWGHDQSRLDRRLDFERQYGHPIEQSTEQEQLGFRDWELENTERRRAQRISRQTTPGDIAATITHEFLRPGEAQQDAADRANIANEINRRDVEEQRALQEQRALETQRARERRPAPERPPVLQRGRTHEIR